MVRGRKAHEAESTFIQTQVDIPLKKKMEEIAREEDVSLSHMVRRAIREYLERRRAA